MNIDTLIVQSGTRRDPITGSISTPIYQVASFVHPELGKSTGYDYSRSGNPTRQSLEEAMARLEDGAGAFAFASGMAAITATLFLFKPGDHLVVSNDLYGGTYRIFQQIFNQYGIEASFVDTCFPEEIEAAIQHNTRALFLETPTNPLMKICDLQRSIELAKKYNLLTIVDNTFMTPYLQQPIKLGADLVVHSATKYLGGHNDLVAGIVVAKTKELAERIQFIQNASGAILGPQDSWLLLRGMKTLALRMERHQENAMKIACWLKKHPAIEKVYYPGLPDHPGHKINKKQAKGFGGMLSFAVKDPELVPHILKNVKIISFAESLGGVESLITFPARQTHADIPEEIREKIGVTNCLLRLSVGIENGEDLIKDLEGVLNEYKR
jgi:cystathionine gamma-synthase